MNRWMFDGRFYCSSCLIEAGIRRGLLAPAARDLAIDEVVFQMVEVNSLDHEEAPQPVLSGERCDCCGRSE